MDTNYFRLHLLLNAQAEKKKKKTAAKAIDPDYQGVGGRGECLVLHGASRKEFDWNARDSLKELFMSSTFRDKDGSNPKQAEVVGLGNLPR